MTHLYLDCETSGLLKRSAPIESAEQPFIVSIAAELCRDDGTRIAGIDTAIRAPEGRKITAGAQSVHGVSSAQAARSGVSELAALGVICGRESFVSQARYVIGHGIEFDRQIITATMARLGREPTAWLRPGLCFLDTMLAATPFCKLAGEHESGGYKWPSLDEACQILLTEEPRAGHHDALDDIQRTKRLYFWLRDRRAFDLPEAA